MNAVRRGALVAAIALAPLGLAAPASALEVKVGKCPPATVQVEVAGLKACVDADLAVVVD